ncbi:MAG: hypothetical protein OES14_03755 [Nitrosopumilus sp.]|nr:hypothetical protein [Nitrosopumilus sp.]MDH3824886.1 hypothetical protein [Nitrosopumilus sp.]
MNKNIVIIYLILVIVILVGSAITSNYPWFSEGWLVGLSLISAGIGTAAIFTYFKIFK